MMNLLLGTRPTLLWAVFWILWRITLSAVDIVSVENFDEYVAEHKLALVHFHEPWCEGCTEFAPIFTKLAENLQSDHEGLRVAKIDTRGDEELLDTLKIKVYPQLVLFANGLPVPYISTLDADKIRAWMRSAVVRSPIKIDTVKQLQSIEYPAIFLFTANETSSRFLLMDNIAKRTPEAGIFYTTSKEIMNFLNITTNNSLEIVQDNRVTLSFTGDYDIETVSNFLVTSQHPMPSPFVLSTIQTLMARGIPLMFIFGNSTRVIEDLLDWSPLIRSNMVVMAAPESTTDKEIETTVEYLKGYCGGKSRVDQPLVCIIRNSNEMQRWRSHGKYSKAKVKNFIYDYLRKDLDPYIEAEKIVERFDDSVEVDWH